VVKVKSCCTQNEQYNLKPSTENQDKVQYQHNSIAKFGYTYMSWDRKRMGSKCY